MSSGGGAASAKPAPAPSKAPSQALASATAPVNAKKASAKEDDQGDRLISSDILIKTLPFLVDEAQKKVKWPGLWGRGGRKGGSGLLACLLARLLWAACFSQPHRNCAPF